MKIIVAADKNWGIGKDNKLLVSIPADMKMFRQETTGKVCVMGRKTLESFPGGLPLKNRTNIVLTRNQNYKVKDAIIVHSIEELMEELKKGFPEFLKENLEKNPLKCEYFLPFVVDELLQEKKAAVRVLTTQDKWYGVTYKEDKPVVVAAIQNLKDQGLYPQGLWD